MPKSSKIILIYWYLFNFLF